MKKTKSFAVYAMLFLSLISYANLSKAETGNPFTIKGQSEFTAEDRRKFEDKIKEEVNQKISYLEDRLKREIRDVNQDMMDRVSRRVPAGMPGPMDGFSPIPGGVPIADVEQQVPMQEAPDPVPSRLRNSTFVGCVDNKALFKNNRTQERFFVPIEEVKDNDEIKEMGNCSF